jgi:adenosylcobyric acid synthase
MATGAGPWAALRDVHVTGYEIHLGSTIGQAHQPLLDLPSGPDGAVSSNGLIAGTYLHGIFDEAEPRQAVLLALARARGFSWHAGPTEQVDPYDELADVLSAALNLDHDWNRFRTLQEA